MIEVLGSSSSESEASWSWLAEEGVGEGDRGGGVWIRVYASRLVGGEEEVEEGEEEWRV